MQKQIYIIIIFLFLLTNSIAGIAPKKDFYLSQDKLLKSNKPIYISGKWKFSYDDSREFSLLTYNDKDWDDGYPNEIADFDLNEDWKGYGWFRKSFTIDRSLVNQTVALKFEHRGAAEVYLNGVLLFEFGKVGRSSVNELAQWNTNDLQIISFDDDLELVIAVRYSNFSAEKLSADFFDKGFTVNFQYLPDAIASKIENENQNMLIILFFSIIPLVFSFLHLSIYFFQLKDIGNLYYGIMTLSIAAVNFFEYLFNNITNHTELFVLNNFYLFPTVFFIIFMLLFTYEYFTEKIPKHFIAFLIVGIFIQLMAVLMGSFDITAYSRIYLLLASIEIGRVIVTSLFKKKIKLDFLVGGFSLFILTVFVQSLVNINILVNIFPLPPSLIGLMVLLLFMSLHLSQNIAKINKELEQEVLLVKSLSEEKLARERKEKEREIERKVLEADHQRKTKELEEARMLQLSLLPSELPELPHLEIAAHMKTATEVGGDYYDVYHDNNGCLTLAIGDATGHGTKAGTLVSATKSLFNALVVNHQPVEMIKKFDSAFKGMNLSKMFMALMIVRFENGSFTFANSGMPPVYVYRSEKDEVEVLMQKSMPLGSPITFEYVQETLKFGRGDTAMFLSDGLIELFNKDEIMLGVKGVKDIFKKCIDKDPNNIIDKLIIECKEWNKDIELKDDYTIVIIKHK
ncbi:MAG: SpoIIE family protein phosphatase [Ignavibacteria bacterium]|jgi:serine phosphatase RsbU (regulator of sigma subunit)